MQNLEQKIEISEKIFEWRNELLATDVGYEFILKGSLWIYHGGWGHIEDDGGWGTWSRLYLSPYSIDYNRGYKNLGMDKIFEFSEPLQMAERLNLIYLEKVLGKIKTKEVYDDILKYNGYLSKY